MEQIKAVRNTSKAMLRKTAFKKKMMLKALNSTLGVVAPAAILATIGRRLHYDWIETDEEYAKQCEDITEKTLDFAETNLFKQIEQGQTQATIFFLKTKGKDRGYTEQQQIDFTNSDGSLQPLTIQLVAQPDLILEGESEIIEETLIHHDEKAANSN